MPLVIPECADVEELVERVARRGPRRRADRARRSGRDHGRHAREHPRVDERDQGGGRFLTVKEAHGRGRTGPHGRRSRPATDRAATSPCLDHRHGGACARGLPLLPPGEGVRCGSGRVAGAGGGGAQAVGGAHGPSAASEARRQRRHAHAGGAAAWSRPARMSDSSSSRASTPGVGRGPPSAPQTSDVDREAVERQLGRPVRAFRRVVLRCPYGQPAVTEQEPYATADAEPFPTTYYLTCPHAVAAVVAVGGGGRSRAVERSGGGRSSAACEPGLGDSRAARATPGAGSRKSRPRRGRIAGARHRRLRQSAAAQVPPRARRLCAREARVRPRRADRRRGGTAVSRRRLLQPLASGHEPERRARAAAVGGVIREPRSGSGGHRSARA